MIFWDLIKKVFGQNIKKGKESSIEKIRRFADRFENAGETEKMSDALNAIDEIQNAKSFDEIKKIERDFYLKAGIHQAPRSTITRGNENSDNDEDLITDNS